MDLRLLRYFITVIDEGSISQAASRLEIAQSAVSRAMQTLEANLGVRLLVRTSRSAKPTDAGSILADEARALLERVNALAERTRTAGSHPYLVPPEHSALARKILGRDPLLAPEQGVVLESDPARAREICRQTIEQYRRFPNYVNNWRRLGFTDDDIANGSDRLIDALFASGEPERIAERVNAHLAAGADHVCLQVIAGAPRPDVGAARLAWRKLAAALL